MIIILLTRWRVSQLRMGTVKKKCRSIQGEWQPMGWTPSHPHTARLAPPFSWPWLPWAAKEGLPRKGLPFPPSPGCDLLQPGEMAEKASLLPFPNPAARRRGCLTPRKEVPLLLLFSQPCSQEEEAAHRQRGLPSPLCLGAQWLSTFLMLW